MEKQKKQSNTSQKGRVLIVDDEVNIRRPLTRQLGSIGYECEAAANGVEALEYLRSEEFEVVLPDLVMPEMSGTDLLEKIYEEKLSVVPVVLTGHGDVPDAIQAMKHGAFDFLQKPCEMSQIKDIADRHGLLIIEDAAHALGAEYRGQKIGSIGNATVFSFHVQKNITTAEGGMVTTDDDELAQELRITRLHGMSRDAWKRSSNPGHYMTLYGPGKSAI